LKITSFTWLQLETKDSTWKRKKPSSNRTLDKRKTQPDL
jgi:hypothetical protein